MYDKEQRPAATRCRWVWYGCTISRGLRRNLSVRSSPSNVCVCVCVCVCVYSHRDRQSNNFFTKKPLQPSTTYLLLLRGRVTSENVGTKAGEERSGRLTKP